MQTPVYNFTGSKSDDAQRFRVHFALSPTGIEDPAGAAEENAVNIYAYNTAVYISNKDNGSYETADVSIYDMYGRSVYTSQTRLGNMTRIPVQVNNAYLVVRVTKGSTTYTEKVFVK